MEVSLTPSYICERGLTCTGWKCRWGEEEVGNSALALVAFLDSHHLAEELETKGKNPLLKLLKETVNDISFVLLISISWYFWSCEETNSKMG